MKQPFNKKLTIILIGFLIIRLIFVAFFLQNDTYYWEDTIHYHTAAVNLVEEGNFGLDAERHDRPFGLEPMYSLMLVPFVWIFGKGFLAIRIFQSLLYLLGGWLFYKIMKKIVREKYALLGTFFFMAYPFYIFFSGVILPEGIYVVLLVSILYFIMRYWHKNKMKDLILISVLMALAIHTKVTSLALMPLIILPLFTERTYQKGLSKIAIAVGVIILLSIPWGIRNYQAFGQVTLPRNYGGEKNKSEVVEKINDTGREGFFNSILKNTKNYFSPTLTKVGTDNKFNKPLYSYISLICVLPLLISTLILPFFYRSKFLYILYSYFIFYALPYILLNGQTRYRLPMDYIMIIFLTITLSIGLKHFIKNAES